MKQYKYDFSVIMAVYNVEAYLSEAVESLIHQTIGFSHIQVILVDDGSTDKSGTICDAYKRKYPDNIIVIHKANGRQASARNAGMPYIQGRFVNFLDPDDVLDKDAMQKVLAFMNSNMEVDICCIPLYFFGDNRGPHMLNNKFDRGTRVINLLDKRDADCILMSSSSSFYRYEAAQKIHFDTELFSAEDAKENMRLLLDKPLFGVVDNTKYRYRRYGNSTLNKSDHRKESYMIYLERFIMWTLEESKKKYGYIPLFVQHTIMYAMQWKLRQSSIPSGVLTEDEEKAYTKLLLDLIAQVDDDVILAQQYIDMQRKYFVLHEKYKNQSDPTAVIFHSNGNRSLKGDVALTFGDQTSVYCSKMNTELEILTYDQKQKSMHLEGYHQLCGIEDAKIIPVVLCNGKVLRCVSVNRPERELKVLGNKISRTIGFQADIPIECDLIDVSVGLVTILHSEKVLVVRKNLNTGKFFPVTDAYKHSYAVIEDRFVCLKKGYGLRISIKSGALSYFLKETVYLREIWKEDRLGGRKAVAGRICYHLTKLLKQKRIWIISDRIMKAGDNGEALFIHLRDNPIKGVKVVFAISRKSGDYERMKKIGYCVDAMSFRHKMLHLISDVVISSHADGVTRNPFLGHDAALKDLLHHQKYIFLQHGITKDDVSGWLNKYNMNIDGFVTASVRERDSIANGNYYYPDSNIWLTGFPRYDRLYHDEKKIITVMPTWRKYLMDSCDSKTGLWKLPDDFEKSQYFRFYNDLLNSKKLLSGLKESGYSLQFLPHPTLQPHINRFDQSPEVNFLSTDASYRKVFAESSLVITDYSSAVFDFAYLRKPVIYCQFDREDFFAGKHVFTKGYYDYERDGFGEVVYTLEQSIDLILEYVRNECRQKELYKKRTDAFFAYDDKGSCRRVVEKVLKLVN